MAIWLVIQNDFENGPVARVVLSERPPAGKLDRRKLPNWGGVHGDFKLLTLSGNEKLVFRIVRRTQNSTVQTRFRAKLQDEYAALIQRLGGKCRLCGSMNRLEVHHPKHRGYEARKLSSTKRIRGYLDEEKRGVELEALCKICNSRLH